MATRRSFTLHARDVSERAFALAVVLELAEWDHPYNPKFSLQQFYDDDMDFVAAVAERLHLNSGDMAFQNKITKVVRVLVNYGCLETRMSSTHKEYIGEPAKQRDYWLPPGKRDLIRRGQTLYTMTPEGEAQFLIRKCYPRPDDEPLQEAT